jgi:hypothetical protein
MFRGVPSQSPDALTLGFRPQIAFGFRVFEGVRNQIGNCCRPAIRAARFGLEADFRFGAVGEISRGRELPEREKRGSVEGAVRIPLRSPAFLFNDLAFRRIPRKPLKSL